MRTGDRLSGWMRRRELASDRRAGRFSRTEAVKRQHAWVRRNWWVVTAHVVFVLATLPLALLLPTWGRGLAAGAWLATGLWFLAFEVVLASGTAPRMMGDRGEQFTATELRRLRRHGWRVINHVALRPTRDIDHVAIGPGGVLVIETKWSGDAWTLDPDLDSRVDRAVERIATNATDIRLMFPEHVTITGVIPLLVLWGGYKVDDGGIRLLDGVTVLRGVELRNWLATLEPEDTFTRVQQDHVWQTLERHVRRRDAADLKREGPPPRTPSEWMLFALGVMFAAWLGVVISATAWTATKSFPLFFVAEAALLAIGWAAFRRKGLAPAAVAWLVSVLAIGVLVAAAAVFSVL